MIHCCMLEYLPCATIEYLSPTLFELLGRPGETSLFVLKWDGTIAGLPDAERVLVHASPNIACSRAELAEVCGRLGHLAFYDDMLLGRDGELKPLILGPVVQQFFESVGRREETKGPRIKGFNSPS